MMIISKRRTRIYGDLSARMSSGRGLSRTGSRGRSREMVHARGKEIETWKNEFVSSINSMGWIQENPRRKREFNGKAPLKRLDILVVVKYDVVQMDNDGDFDNNEART